MATYQELEQRRIELQNLNTQIEQRYAGMIEGGRFTGSQTGRASLEAQRSALAERERQIIEQQRKARRAQEQLTVIERMKGKTGMYAPLVRIQERKAELAAKAGAEATEAYNKSVEDFNRKTQQVYESYQHDVEGLTPKGESFNRQVSEYNQQLEDEYNRQVQRQQEFGDYLQKVAEGVDAPQTVDLRFSTRPGRNETIFRYSATIDIPSPGTSERTYGETIDGDIESLKTYGLEGVRKLWKLGPEDRIMVDGKVIQESSFTPEEISAAKQVFAGRTAALEQYRREQELEQDRLKTGWGFAQKDAARLQSLYDQIATLAPTKQAEALKEQLKGSYAKEAVEGMRWEVGGVTFSRPEMAEKYAGQLSEVAGKQRVEGAAQAGRLEKIPLFDETGKPAFVLEGPAPPAAFKRDPKYGLLVHQDLYEDFGEKVTRKYNEIESEISNKINESSYGKPVFTALRDVSRLVIPFGMTRTGTKMIESGVEELRVKPLTAMTNVAIAALLTKGFSTLAKMPEFAPAVKAAGYGLGGIYAADVTVRLAGSEDRVREVGKIAYTELMPFAAGAKIGSLKLPRDLSIPSPDYSYDARSRAFNDLLQGNIKKVDLRRVLSEHQYNNVEWQDYELWLKSGRLDVLERKYPTPEPIPPSRTMVQGTELKKIGTAELIPEEWYGKRTLIEQSPEFSRVGIGGQRSKIALPKDLVRLYPDLNSKPAIERLLFPFGQKTDIVLGEKIIKLKDITGAKEPTDIQTQRLIENFKDKKFKELVEARGYKPKELDKLVTPGEELVEIPKARIPPSGSKGKGHPLSAFISKDLTTAIRERAKAREKILSNLAKKTGYFTTPSGQMVRQKTVLLTEMAKQVSKQEVRTVDLRTELVKLQSLESILRIPVVLKTPTASVAVTKQKTRQVSKSRFAKQLASSQVAVKQIANELLLAQRQEVKQTPMLKTKQAQKQTQKQVPRQINVLKLTQPTEQVQRRVQLQKLLRAPKQTTKARTKTVSRTKQRTALKTPRQFEDYIEKRRRSKSKYEWDIENPVPTLESLLGG